MIEPGQPIADRSPYTVMVQGQDEQALLRDPWGLFYVTDTKGLVQYAGASQAGAEGEWLLQKTDPCPYVDDRELWVQVVGPDIPFMAKEEKQ